jgi:release factor glutamine methyltransferase
MICANLPYVPGARLPALKVSAHEPRLALEGAGQDGFGLVRTLAGQARTRLAPGGLLLAEIDVVQEAAALQLAAETWPAARAEVLKDLTGRPRLLRVQI